MTRREQLKRTTQKTAAELRGRNSKDWVKGLSTGSQDHTTALTVLSVPTSFDSRTC